MNMAKQVTTHFLKEARSGKLGHTAQLYPSPAELGGWEGFYKGFIIGNYNINGAPEHIGYIKWSDYIGSGSIRVRTNNAWWAGR